MTETDAALQEAARQFEQMSETARQESAPLYELVCAAAASDPEILELATYARAGQPVAYLVMAAVHYLLLGGMKDDLAAYYPSLTETPLDRTAVYPVFRRFCVENAAAIRELVATHNNQTNEVGRMAALMPAIGVAARRAGGRPLGLIEVGPSAGLNLCFDRYHFDYGRVQWGDPASPVQVRTLLEDDRTPTLVAGEPVVAWRAGLDIEPVDVTDPDAARWMLSSTWPDHRERRQVQRQAIEVLCEDPPLLIPGDALEVGRLIEEVPPDLTLCVYESFMRGQLTPAAQRRFVEILGEAGRQRDLYFVSMTRAAPGTDGARRARVDLDSWVKGEHTSELLVEGRSYGLTIRWMGD